MNGQYTYPRCLSIMVEERIIAAGLARFVPMMSLATCRQPGSKRAYSWTYTRSILAQVVGYS